MNMAMIVVHRKDRAALVRSGTAIRQKLKTEPEFMLGYFVIEMEVDYSQITIALLHCSIEVQLSLVQGP